MSAWTNNYCGKRGISSFNWIYKEPPSDRVGQERLTTLNHKLTETNKHGMKDCAIFFYLSKNMIERIVLKINLKKKFLFYILVITALSHSSILCQYTGHAVHITAQGELWQQCITTLYNE